MMRSYRSGEMSAKTKAICERGKFFIETGTGTTFLKFLHNSSGNILKYTPFFLVQRIADLINQGDRSSAVTLWTKICAEADSVPRKVRSIFLFYLTYAAIGFMAIYSFIRTILN